jgi:hypothetical protein
MTYRLKKKTRLLLERRSAELGLTPSTYLERLVETERLVEMDTTDDNVGEDTPLTAIPEPRYEPDPPMSAQDMARGMARGVVILFRLWGITDDQAAKLLSLSMSEYGRWANYEFGAVGSDTAARLANLSAIHRSLSRIFLEPGRSYSWIKEPVLTFGGRTALELLLEGDLPAFIRVRRFLDAQPRWERID